jgi:CrcB protein
VEESRVGADELRAGGPWGRLPLDPDVDEDVDGDVGPNVDEDVDERPPRQGARTPPGRTDPRVLAAIALGAMPGAAARYGLSLLVPTHPGGFPWTTFWTNLSGSFALGFLLVVLVERFPPSRSTRAFAGTGFLGAYTTFSTFSVEADLLLKDGHLATATAYVTASLVVGLAAAFGGMLAARRCTGRGREGSPS